MISVTFGIIAFIAIVYFLCFIIRKIYFHYKYRDVEVEQILKEALKSNCAVLTYHTNMYAFIMYKHYSIKISIYEGIFSLCNNGEIRNMQTNDVYEWHYIQNQMSLWVRVKVLELLESSSQSTIADDYVETLEKNLEVD